MIPPVFTELKNKTLLIAVENYVLFLKIKNDKIYNSCCLDRFLETEMQGVIIDAMEIENQNIILENLHGDIFVAVKNKNISEEELNKEYDEEDKLFLNFDYGEYELKYKINHNDKNIGRDIHPFIYSKNNTIFCDNFKIDFSSDKFEKIKTNKINIMNGWTKKLSDLLNNKFEFKDFVLGLNEEKELVAISKKYEEVISIIKLENQIGELIHIENNIYLCSFENDKKIYLVDLSDFRIIDSKEYNFKYIVKNENENKILLIDI